HAVALLEVAAGAEGALARAGEDDAAQLARRRDETAPQRLEIAPHLSVERVGDLRSVESDDEQFGLRRLEAQGGVGGHRQRAFMVASDDAITPAVMGSTRLVSEEHRRRARLVPPCEAGMRAAAPAVVLNRPEPARLPGRPPFWRGRRRARRQGSP